MKNELIILISIGAVCGLPMILAPVVLMRDQRRMAHVLASMQSEAIARGVFGQFAYLHFHRALLKFAAVLPLLVSGDAKMKRVPIDEETSRELQEFIERNAWMQGYLATATMVATRNEYLAAPSRIRFLPAALLASLVLRFCSENDIVRVGFVDPEESREQVERISSINPNDRCANGDMSFA